MRIDAHAHVLPRDWPDLAERHGEAGWPRLEHVDACSARIMIDGKLFRDVDDRLYDTARRLEAMDETGVDRQLLSTVPVMFSYWAAPKHTRELARHLNEHLASLVAEHPDRFDALGTVPLNDTSLAISELERCVGELGMPGVEIATNVGGENLDDPRLEPFFARASELGAIVFVHPWQVIGAERLPRDYYALYTTAMPSETAFAFAALAFGGVLERHSGMHVLLAHGGGSVPYVIGRMDRGWSVWEPARRRAPRAPSEYLRGCFCDSVCWDERSLELLVARVGADRVLLGSDYPFIMGENRPGEMVERSGLGEREKRSILGGSCAALLEMAGGATAARP